MRLSLCVCVCVIVTLCMCVCVFAFVLKRGVHACIHMFVWVSWFWHLMPVAISYFGPSITQHIARWIRGRPVGGQTLHIFIVLLCASIYDLSSNERDASSIYDPSSTECDASSIYDPSSTERDASSIYHPSSTECRLSTRIFSTIPPLPPSYRGRVPKQPHLHATTSCLSYYIDRWIDR